LSDLSHILAGNLHASNDLHLFSCHGFLDLLEQGLHLFCCHGFALSQAEHGFPQWQQLGSLPGINSLLCAIQLQRADGKLELNRQGIFVVRIQKPRSLVSRLRGWRTAAGG